MTLFFGIGAPEKALTNLNIDYNLVGFSEIDKFAIKSYTKIHGVPEEKNFGDINKYAEWDIKEKIDLLVYGFPCQDISLSGHCKGLFNNDGSLTRSGLFFKALGVIEKHKPKVAIAENVKNLTSKKFKEQFEIVLNSLEAAGYNNYWKILNAADFGIPQNRERVFIVSIRKDVDNGVFKFPDPFPLEHAMKDFLETNVDDKYYLSPKMIDFISSFGTKSFYYKPEIDLDIARPITASMHKMHRASADNYVSDEFIKNGEKQDILVIRTNNKKGFDTAKDGDYINISQPKSKTRRGRIGHQIAQTIDTSSSSSHCVVLGNPARIRRLTPIESFALMGFEKNDARKLQAEKISDTQLYKMAGNSIVVDVLEEIFCQMLDENNNIMV